MENYNLTLQGNNTDLQTILDTINELPEAGGEQATPEISVSSNGLVTAVAGAKTSTYQLVFQAAKTITPSTVSQVAVSSGYYTGGDITVAAIPSTYVIPSGTSTITANGTYDVGGYASAVVNVEGSGSGEVAEWSEVEDAIISRTISGEYINDRITSIGAYAFQSCTSLTTVSFPACTSISAYAFRGCSSLTTASFPACTSVGSYAFLECSSLTTASFPACTSIGSYAFNYCKSLTTVSFPVCTSIGGYAFADCSKLTTVSFPACTTIGSSAFSYCTRLTTVSFPVCTTVRNSAFYYAGLVEVSFPACTSIGAYAFQSCTSLTTVSFPACTSISAYAFRSCHNLTSLYLLGSSLCTLSNSNAFTSTPIGGYSTSAGTYGSIYVPASLYDSYITATNWTYFSSRFASVASTGIVNPSNPTSTVSS